jgi:hypothetical protein
MNAGIQSHTQIPAKPIKTTAAIPIAADVRKKCVLVAEKSSAARASSSLSNSPQLPRLAHEVKKWNLYP